MPIPEKRFAEGWQLDQGTYQGRCAALTCRSGELLSKPRLALRASRYAALACRSGELFLDTSGLAAALAQVVKLGSPDIATAFHFN